jgi:hypothetical protein
MGNTSTIGLKATYASGKRDNNKVSISKFIYLDKVSKINNIRFNNINFTIKLYKFLFILMFYSNLFSYTINIIHFTN